MKHAPDPREAKLPNWAQNMLNALRRSLTDALRAAEEARLATSPDESNAVIDRFEAGAIGLGNATVTFKLGEHWTETIQARVQGKLLVVNGADQITIHPSSGNAVEIRVDR